MASEAMALLESIDGPLTVGRLVNSVRLSDEYSMFKMGHLLGISQRCLRRIEQGRELVSPERAYAWGELLGYSGNVWAWAAERDWQRPRRETASYAPRMA